MYHLFTYNTFPDHVTGEEAYSWINQWDKKTKGTLSCIKDHDGYVLNIKKSDANSTVIKTKAILVRYLCNTIEEFSWGLIEITNKYKLEVHGCDERGRKFILKSDCQDGTDGYGGAGIEILWVQDNFQENWLQKLS